MRIAIIAALPGELKQLVSTGIKRAPASQVCAKKWVRSMGEDTWIAVCAGMGGDAARRAFLEAEAEGAIDLVLSVGWAGALVDGLASGGIYLASAVIDARTGERFELADGKRDEALVTTAHVALEPEKRRLAETYGAKFVDMESATVLRLAQMRGIPAVCMKAISDDVGERLPNFNPYIDPRGQMQMARFVGYAMIHPVYWSALLRLGRSSQRGASSLASAVVTFLTGSKDVQRVNRTGNVDG